MNINKNDGTKEHRSIVWNYFKKENNISARCKLCTKILKHGGNTTNLMQHIKRKHILYLQSESTSQKTSNAEPSTKKNKINEEQEKQSREEEEEIDNPDNPDNSIDVPSCSMQHKIEQRSHERIDDAFQRINSFKAGGTIACNITNLIMYMIAKDNLPLSIVDNEGFNQLMKTIAPLYTVPSRKTITKLLDAKYEVLKDTFIKNIQKALSFTLTCDIWTDVSNKSYLGITIHYLKTETLLTKGIIGVIPLEKNHTSEYIRDELLSVLEIFKINQTDITAVVTDSAPNMVNAINSIFGAKKHIPCIAHMLAHLVPDSLKTIYTIEEIITKVKNIVTFIRKSVVASDELIRLQKRDGKTDGTVLKFKQEVPTRWNSMLYMIQRFLQLREYVYPVLLKCSTSLEMVTRTEFNVLHDVVNILQPIELVTKEIGGDLYPTCSIIIPIIRCMKIAINDYIPMTDDGENFKKKILLETERRFHDIEKYQILAISTILDPRFKKIHFEQPMAVSSAISYINTLMQIASKNNDSNKDSNMSITSVVECNQTGNLWKFHDHLVASSTATRDDPGGINVELRQYLNQCIIPRHHDPLKYWQTIKHAYPVLFNIAQKYLSVIATSVPSERLFSKAGIVKSDARNRLTANRLNTLLFLGSLNYEDWKFV